MVLETTVICMDNSEWMRNGDHFPTRLDAQHDAARTDSHPENTIGLLTMAGKGVELLASPTEDMKKLMGALSRITLYGKCDFLTSVQIAQLALKHRKGNVQAKRIVVFIGSPVDASEETIAKVGASLKKNNVAVDVVVMGEHDAIHSKMLAFVNAANSSDNSHLISVPPGVSPSDAIITSPLLSEFGTGMEGVSSGAAAAEGGAAAGGAGGQFAEYGGIDPSLDPELAMVLRASMEEARAHQAALAAAAAAAPAPPPAPEGQAEASGAPSATATAATGVASEGFPDLSGMDDEEALLQTALAMSMQEASASASASSASSSTPVPPSAAPAPAPSATAPAEIDIAELDEEEAIQQALLLSMGLPIPPPASASASASTPAANPIPTPAAPAPASTASAPAATSAAATPPAVPATFLDDDFVNQLLGSVDVDPNDPAIVAMRAQMKPKDETSDDSKK